MEIGKGYESFGGTGGLKFISRDLLEEENNLFLDNTVQGSPVLENY